MILAGLLLFGLTPQTGGMQFPSEQEIRADASMRRAWQGRRAAVARICGETSRIVRIRALDERFSQAQQSYQRRFSSSWDGQDAISDARLNKEIRPGENGVLSTNGKVDPQCRSINAFAGALGEYQNGLAQAEATLADK